MMKWVEMMEEIKRRKNDTKLIVEGGEESDCDHKQTFLIQKKRTKITPKYAQTRTPIHKRMHRQAHTHRRKEGK